MLLHLYLYSLALLNYHQLSLQNKLIFNEQQLIQRNIHTSERPNSIQNQSIPFMKSKVDRESSLQHRSEFGQSKQNTYFGVDINNLGMDNDSEEDDMQINNYHKLLLQTYSDEVKSQASSHQYLEPLQGNAFQQALDQTDKQSMKSAKSHFSTNSVKSHHSEGMKSVQTLRTEQSGESGNNESKDMNKQKRKYMKQQARRIKQQLKQEQMRMKKQKKQFKDLDIDMDGKRRLKSTFGKHRRKRLTKKTLELLAKKFDQYYAYDNNYDYKGPKMNIREIGQLFDMGNNTIHKLYTEWMEDPSFYQRINRENCNKKTPQRKITLERLEHVARLIKQNPFLTQNELTVELNKIEDLKYIKNGQKVEITRTTVARLLKVGKFKKKRVKCVPKQRNTTKSLQKRFDYCKKYEDIWMKNSKIYFLDQSGFNLYMTRDKAWARPNQEITVNCPISKGKRFSLIAIISDDGLTHWRIIQGTYRKYEYLDFIKQLFARFKEEQQQIPQQQRQPQRQKWLILDNCAIHDKDQTVSLGKQCGVQILYLPPYSPQLNPIENWFNQVKSKIRKINYSTQKQLLQIMHRTLKEYQDYDFSNYYKGILKHVQKGINKQKF